MLDNQKLEAIRKRAEAATPGPWSWWDDGTLYSEGEERILGKAVEGEGGIWFDLFDNDAEFIAHAREDVPRLLAEIERLQQEKEKYKQDIVPYRKWLNANLKEKRKMEEQLQQLIKKIKRYEKVLKIIAEHEDRYFWNGYHRNDLWKLAKKALEGTE